jgi:WD40 repeat protein
MWDAASGREIATFLGHTDKVDFAAISRDNRLIVSASQDGTVRIWDTKTGKEKVRLDEKAYSAVFGPNNKTILTLSADGIKQWSTRNGKLVRIFSETYTENISEGSFRTENTYFLSGNGEIKILNIKIGDYITIKDTLLPMSATAISKDKYIFAASYWNGKLSLSTSYRQNNMDFQAHEREVTAITFSNDNRFLASASRDKKIHIWDIEHYQNSQEETDIRPFKTFHIYNADVNSLSFSPDNRFITAALTDKTIKIWDMASGEVSILGGYSAVPVLSVISHDSRFIASLNQSGSLNIWNAKNGIFIESIDNIGEISSLIFSNNNESLITVSSEGTVESFNIKTGKKNQLLVKDEEHFAIVRSFDQGGKKIVSVLWDGTIEIWDYTSGEVKKITQDEGLIIAAGLDRGGEHLAEGFINGKLQVTDLKNEKVLLSVQYESPVAAVGFRADAQLLACGLRDGSIRLLDISTGKEIIPPMRHLFGVSSVSFSADGKRIISAASDNTTVLWNAETGEKIASFISFGDNEWITITGDGYYNASPRGDERLNVRIGGEIYGMDQFSAVFHQAEVVNARLEGIPALASVTKNNMQVLVPPAITINAPVESNTGTAAIDISIKDLFRPLHAIQVVINGRLLGAEELGLVNANANLSVENTSIVVKSSISELKFTLPVNLEAGSNRVQVIATNKGNQSASGAEGRKSVFIVNVSETAAPAPDLWLLAIGSNSPIYGRNENGLKYAVNNAIGIVSLFENQQGKRYRNVHTRLIVDEDEIAMSREHILGTIKEFFGKARSNDILVLFVSGHGEYRESGSGYYFLPQAISLDDIGVLAEMPGRKIIFIDSCFSGGVDDKRLAGKLKNQSTVIITSSQKDERSWEGSAAVSYGFFTEALITGIGGEAAVNNEVRLHNLGDYVYNKVNLLTGGMQNPYVYVPEGFWGFVLAEK